MAKVAITEQYLEDIADAIRSKTGMSSATYYPSEMAGAIMTISGGGGITPTGTISITENGTYNVTTYASADVDVPTGSTINNQNKTVSPSTSQQSVTYDSGYTGLGTVTVNAMPSGTEGTPTATKGTVSNHSISVTPSVTNTTGYITGSTKTGTAVTVTASELVSGSQTITSNGTYDVTNLASIIAAVQAGLDIPIFSIDVRQDTPSVTCNKTFLECYNLYNNDATAVAIAEITTASATLTMAMSAIAAYANAYMIYSIYDQNGVPNADITFYGNDSGMYSSPSILIGNEGTPTATKGTVSNHSVSITPSVTNSSGYITGGTKTGTAVTVSASELVSGSETKTANGTYDVTNLASLVVNVSGGGGSSMQTGNLEGGATSTSSISFTGLQGEPTAFSFMIDASVTTGTPSKIVAVVFDGTSLHAQTITNTANAQVTYDSTSLSKTYSNGTLTITSNGPSFILDAYYGVYVYDGGAVDTKDVQVGSGATSITFTGLEAEPAWWSCIFKSNFSTSSGYQRVIYVAEGSTTGNISGLEMDSGAHNAMHWTASYNNGSFTITSQGTNAGGYFHQPGYYQLTYAYDDGSSGNYQSKTVTPTTSQQVITADSGYDALKQVTVNAMPTGSATAPSTISGTSATVSTGTNTLTLTKTISVTPTVSAGYVSSGTAGNSSVSLTASVTTKVAATITPTTTNQTIAAGTYLTGTQTIAGDADLVASNIVSGVQIFGVTGNVVLQNYYTGSSAPSSSLGSNGDLYLQS